MVRSVSVRPVEASRTRGSPRVRPGLPKPIGVRPKPIGKPKPTIMPVYKPLKGGACGSCKKCVGKMHVVGGSMKGGVPTMMMKQRPGVYLPGFIPETEPKLHGGSPMVYQPGFKVKGGNAATKKTLRKTGKKAGAAMGAETGAAIAVAMAPEIAPIAAPIGAMVGKKVGAKVGKVAGKQLYNLGDAGSKLVKHYFLKQPRKRKSSKTKKTKN